MNVRVPGDKSLTQRALIFAALGSGESRLTGLLHGGDAASTAGALRALGAGLPELPGDGGELRVGGVGLRGLRAPRDVLDLGNSGTGSRLLMGVLAGAGFDATLTGDASLRSRPMARITEPLSAMGASFTHRHEEGRLPMTVHGRHPLAMVDWPGRVASAQVKSALLLAGLTGRAPVLLSEPRRSRDHTERMLAHLGVGLVCHAGEGGWRVEMRDPPSSLPPLDFDVPGDVSSAAFVAAFAALGGTPGPVRVEHVGLNPTRTAFLEVLQAMGADMEVTPASEGPGEPVGSLLLGPGGGLRGVRVAETEVPRLIDELPLVAVLGARAEGTTTITGAAELRHKESDRIAAVAGNLRTLGVEVEELPDGMVVEGSDAPMEGSVRTFHDHRIAMAFGLLAALPGNDITIDHPEAADVSFPGFWDLLDRLRTGRTAP